MSNSWHHILTISPAVYWVGNNRRTVETPTTPHISDQSGTENTAMLTFHHDMTSGFQYLLPLESDELLCIVTPTVHFQLTIFKSQYIFSWQFLKYQYKLITWHVLQNVKQLGRNLVINWNDVANIGTILAHYWPIKHINLNSLNISKQHLAPM